MSVAKKRCQLCGELYNPVTGTVCAVRGTAGHIPTDRPGMVYVLCLGEPAIVAQADRGHVQPTSHYVGWTGQKPPERRVRQHKAPLESIASMTPGTAEDELDLKRFGLCPRCDMPLAPECLGNVPAYREWAAFLGGKESGHPQNTNWRR